MDNRHAGFATDAGSGSEAAGPYAARSSFVHAVAQVRWEGSRVLSEKEVLATWIDTVSTSDYSTLQKLRNLLYFMKLALIGLCALGLFAGLTPKTAAQTITITVGPTTDDSYWVWNDQYQCWVWNGPEFQGDYQGHPYSYWHGRREGGGDRDHRPGKGESSGGERPVKKGNVEQSKAEAERPNPEQPKAEEEKPKEQQQKAEAEKPKAENKAGTEKPKMEKPKAEEKKDDSKSKGE